PILVFTISLIAYVNFSVMQAQIDRRILSLVYQEQNIFEATIENNRDFIFEGVWEKIGSGYWLIGIPYHNPIFTRSVTYQSEVVDLRVTDTSLINVLLRYGLFPLILII